MSFIIIIIIIRISCNVYDIAVSLLSPNMTSQDTIRLFRVMSIPTMFRLFRVLTSEMLGRRLPVYRLLLWQRQHIIFVDAVDYK
jgi:hypothetical protein